MTEFWRRMGEHLGPAYADSYARDHVLAELDGRTAQQALDAGVDAVEVWRAVWAELGLPARER